MKFGVVVFPGSNCDHDAFHAVQDALGQQAAFLWHQSTDLERSDAIILPGGFSYGDYLRTGAIAHFAPIMESVKKFAARGGLVLGICNGFQILLESGMLKGAMLRNRNLRFICRPVHLRVENVDTPFTNALRPGQVLSIPINHGEGNYYVDDETLETLQRRREIVFRYCEADGGLSDRANPNGSLHHIAGICNRSGNVMGMMPHPERACEALLGSTDGRTIFQSAINAISGAYARPKATEAVAPHR
ncbi:MAG: phosphoribosylformylglycinamidine synthase subunit PurQ [Acidobacteria bacterium]|nr:phosphoribosylformylglycinamidine synthase subunit PurQ [Acidobacteriota bacterium]